MNLSTIYKNTNYVNVKPSVREVLEDIELIDFRRERRSETQTFYFDFILKEQKYTLEHSFSYDGKGVEHWFKFKKSIFEKKPFDLTHKEMCILSEELMVAVNKWSMQET